MAKTGRPSTIVGTGIQGRVDALLDDGVSYAEVSTRTGASPQSVQRYANLRKSELAKLIDGDPAITDAAHRLIAIADDAQSLRRTLTKTGTPVARIRAIKAEADVITKLLREVNCSDLALEDALAEVMTLAGTLKTFVMTQPEHARPLIEMFRKSSTPDLGEALARQLPAEKTTA